MRYTIPLAALVMLFACTPAGYRQEADDQVYAILEKANQRVTGNATVFPIDRPVDTLRARLLTSSQPVELSLLEALDVAAENSFQFQQQKERLYLSALTLTRQQNDFAIRWTGGGSADISGQGDEQVDVDFSSDLSASVNTIAGTNIMLGFVNNLMRSVINGGGFDGSTILSLTLTQPLLGGASETIVREPLTQAERNVVYAVRDFEQFRRAEAVNIVSDYYGVAQSIVNLDNFGRDLLSREQNFERAEALFGAGRGQLNDVDRARQDLLSSRNRVIDAEANLDTALDRFKQRLGLPTDSVIVLDPTELDRVRDQGVIELDLTPEEAVELSLMRRYDYQTALDSVDDAARTVIVAEDALKSTLDFSSVISVPSDPDDALKPDWSNVNWAAGFDLNLALNKLPERNSYRSALINLDVAIRAREQLEDAIKADVRLQIRNIRQRLANYETNELALTLAERRVESTRDLYQAGRVQQIDVNDAQDALVSSEFELVGTLVDYSVARLDLMNALEALMLEPQGLRFDPGLPIPTGPLLTDPNALTPGNTTGVDTESNPPERRP